ncbi:cytochrome c [Caenispirillum salinarum]|uniref:cytochrome c n=1 Tax=Caenispirillum salinarum TaxID=859058 RepID=UPI0038507C25
MIPRPAIRRTTAVAGLLVLSLSPPAVAQDDAGPGSALDAGRLEYMNSCAPCHGEAAAGDGPVANYVGQRFPDLTKLAEANDGRFPVIEVFRMIDGRASLEAHGERLMPVWGQRYMIEGTYEDLPMPDEARRQIVLGRLVELVAYLQSIQDPKGDAPPLLGAE